jgi:hypothetical protein
MLGMQRAESILAAIDAEHIADFGVVNAPAACRS